MSEDSVTVDFSIRKKYLDKKKISSLISSYANSSDCQNVDIQYEGNNIRVLFDFCMFFEGTIKLLLIDLASIHAENMVVSCWYDTSGEKSYYILSGEKLLAFNSKDELKEYQRNSERTSFDFGKPSNSEVALIRLKVKSKRKQKKIAAVFESAINLKSDDIESFKAQFQSLNYPDGEIDAIWCAYDDCGDWRKGPEELIFGLEFVLIAGDFVYLGFDISDLTLWPGFTGSFDIDLDKLDSEENLGLMEEYEKIGPIVENLMYTLERLDGVSKVWVKFRMTEFSRNEIYSYFPGMADDYSVAYYLNISEDDSWPNITAEMVVDNEYAHIMG